MTIATAATCQAWSQHGGSMALYIHYRTWSHCTSTTAPGHTPGHTARGEHGIVHPLPHLVTARWKHGIVHPLPHLVALYIHYRIWSHSTNEAWHRVHPLLRATPGRFVYPLPHLITQDGGWKHGIVYIHYHAHTTRIATSVRPTDTSSSSSLTHAGIVHVVVVHVCIQIIPPTTLSLVQRQAAPHSLLQSRPPQC